MAASGEDTLVRLGVELRDPQLDFYLCHPVLDGRELHSDLRLPVSWNYSCEKRAGGVIVSVTTFLISDKVPDKRSLGQEGVVSPQESHSKCAAEICGKSTGSVYIHVHSE